MESYPVAVESMLFTMVDPHAGHEVAYNRWYERDHFYGGCMVGPWLFAGSRWVATRDLKARRFPDDSVFAEPVTAGSYLSIYWIHAGHVSEHLKWAGEQVVQLYKDGRGFQERTHAHTCLYDNDGATYGADETVSLELALDHRFASLCVLVTEPSSDDAPGFGGPTEAQLGEAPTVRIWSSWSLHGSGVQGSSNAPMSLGTDGGRGDRLVHLLFCDTDADTAFDQVSPLAQAIGADPATKLTFAAAFRPTIIGTDTYTDQLF